MKGMASKVSCLSRKVGGKTWRPFCRSVKNARFHPTKHLSRCVLKLEAEWYSTPTIFRLNDIFDFFVSGSPASSKMTTEPMPKHTYSQLSKRSRNLRENSLSVPVWVVISKRPSLSVKLSFLTSVNEKYLQ